MKIFFQAIGVGLLIMLIYSCILYQGFAVGAEYTKVEVKDYMVEGDVVHAYPYVGVEDDVYKIREIEIVEHDDGTEVIVYYGDKQPSRE